MYNINMFMHTNWSKFRYSDFLEMIWDPRGLQKLDHIEGYSLLLKPNNP